MSFCGICTKDWRSQGIWIIGSCGHMVHPKGFKSLAIKLLCMLKSLFCANFAFVVVCGYPLHTTKYVQYDSKKVVIFGLKAKKMVFFGQKFNVQFQNPQINFCLSNTITWPY